MRYLLLFLLAVGLEAQAAHTVTLAWVDAQNPAATTYNVKRATGLCTGSPTFATLANALTVKTYIDNTVQPGNYCYVVTATFSGIESSASNSALAPVPTFAPSTLTLTVQ